MTQTVATVLEFATKILGPVADGDPRREARILLAHVLDRDANAVLLSPEQPLADAEAEQFITAVRARTDHQPISQILGKRAFWDHDFKVTPDVLDPRPDTELLVELALAQSDARRVLDLGTGSGCILCSVLYALPNAMGLGTDVSQSALAVAGENARTVGVEERTEFRHGSWFDTVDGEFDLILSNPPYITANDYQDLHPGVRNWEPELALTDGLDGLQAYRDIACDLDQYLALGGVGLFEHGEGQSRDVMLIFQTAGFAETRSFNDLNGKDRVVRVAR